MTAPIQAGAQGGVNPRALRGLALFRSRAIEARGDLIVVRGSRRSYTVSLEQECCTCPDFQRRQKACKHLFAATIYAAKRRCRRSTASRPSRRHGQRQEIPRETREGHRDQSSGGGDIVRPRRSDGSRESLRGIRCDPERLEKIAAWLRV